jgi:thiol:disulfide interchange protein
MLFRLFLVLLTTVHLTGFASAQDSLADPFNSGTLFGPATEPAGTVDVSAKLIQLDALTVELQVTVTPSDPFYIYSTTTPSGQKTKIILNKTAGLQPIQQGFVSDHPAKKEFSEDFGDDVEKFTSTVTWSQQLRSTTPLTGTIQVSGNIKGQICSSGEGGVCLLLVPAPEFSAELTADETMAAPEPSKPKATSSGVASTVAVIQENVSLDEAKLGYTVSLIPADAQPGDEVTLSIRADMAAGWHTYSTTMVADLFGGTPTNITLTEIHGLQDTEDKFTASTAPEVKESSTGSALELHHQTVTWSRRFVVSDANASVVGTIEGQLCTETTCKIPGTAHFTVALGGSTDAQPFAFATAPSHTPEGEGTEVRATDEVVPGNIGVAADAKNEGLFVFLIAAVGAGFIALLTPCVFPMIPVTVAFFLKQGESGKGNTKLLAVVYCLGIIGSFTVIGVLVSVIFGPQKMTELANGPWLNLIFAIVFVAFALMLMGVFELRVPTGLLNWSARREGKGGVLGVLFMSLTFTLVSFTCTAAFVANLLVLAAKGDYLWPTLGMLAFSTAFALPFFFLALFPGLLKSLPKSGGWMQKVKCTAGLIELAFVVKFLSVADIGFSPDATPRFIDFSTAMVVWATLAFVTGLYLLGVFRFSKDTPTEGISPIGGLWAMACIGLGLLICVGLFSPKPPESWIWNQLAGFAPPQFERDVVNDQFEELAQTDNWLSHEGLAYALEVDDVVAVAKKHGRPLFIDFTGVNCVNCRTMEKSVLNQPEILDILATVPRAQLYLDKVPTVKDNQEADAILERNRQFCLQLTNGTAMPTYVILSPDGETVLSGTSGVVSQEKFRLFLDTGIRRFKKNQQDVAELQSSKQSTETVR